MGGLVRLWLACSALWSVVIVAQSRASPFTYSLDLPLVGAVMWNLRDQIIAILVPWLVGAVIVAAVWTGNLLRSR